MPKTKEQKKEILASLDKKIKDSKAIVFAKFDRLTVKENESLREKLRQENGEYLVIKKTLLDKSLRENNIEADVKNFDGRIAAIFGYEDEVSPAKIIFDFKKEEQNKEKIDFVGGVLENKAITPDEVENLAKLPSKQELYAKMVGSLNAPISGFVNALAGNLRNFVYVLKAIEEKKQ